MAEPFTTPVSSASKDDAASEPCRYAHGSEVIAELRARVNDYRRAAKVALEYNKARGNQEMVSEWKGILWAIGVFNSWLDELSGSDQTQHEGTKPSSEPWA